MSALPDDENQAWPEVSVLEESFRRALASKVQKVSVSMPAELTDLVRSRTGTGGFSRYVAHAVAERLRHDLLGELLNELEGEFGQVSAEIREQTRRMWPDQADE